MTAKTTVATQDPEPNGKRSRASHLRWVPIAKMRVSPKAQREFRKTHAEKYAADFDFEAVGFPVVSLREGHYWIVDGQHRVEALKMIGWGDQQIQCECYEGLSESEEAELFLRRDERKAIRPFDKFKIALVAGRETETKINATVAHQGLKISTDASEDSIAAISALRKVYETGGSTVLGRDLRILRDGLAGDLGKFRSELITGVGLVCQRYNGQVKDEEAVQKLQALRGGSSALIHRANSHRAKTGRPMADCVAAAFVDTINTGKGTKKMDPWWK